MLANFWNKRLFAGTYSTFILREWIGLLNFNRTFNRKLQLSYYLFRDEELLCVGFINVFSDFCNVFSFVLWGINKRFGVCMTLTSFHRNSCGHIHSQVDRNKSFFLTFWFSYPHIVWLLKENCLSHPRTQFQYAR